MVSPTAVIGDVHGDVLALHAMLGLVADRHLVFVGDLVNRGSDTREVLELVVGLTKAKRATLVQGNHEAALLRYWRGEMSFVDFALIGGLPTLRSYLSQASGDVWRSFHDVFPQEHMLVLEQASEEHWIGAALVKHWDLEAELVLANRDGRTSRGSPLIVGHTIVERATRIGDVVFLDSGCGSGGSLSAFLLPEESLITTADAKP